MNQICLFLILLLSYSSTIYAKFDLAICAIFQDDAPYLKEWIEFHKLQGVEHFFLYNNNSKDDYESVLNPYIRKREVTLIQWPYTYEYGDHDQWIRIQSGAYKNCIRKYGYTSKWLAVIDTDEFLFSPKGILLPKILAEYARYGGLCVNWIKFGTSQIPDVPKGKLMIELLTHCIEHSDPDNHFIKSIVQPRRIAGCNSAHYFLYKRGFYAVGADHLKISGTRSVHPLLDKIRINHYWSRTEKYFYERKIASRQKRRTAFTTDKLLDMERQFNASQDSAILRFVPALRKNMGFSNEGHIQRLRKN